METVLDYLLAPKRDWTLTVLRSEDLLSKEVASNQCLADRAGAAAAALRKLGLRRGDRIMFFLDTSVQLVAGVLGAWAVGAITNIQPTHWPRNHRALFRERLRAMVRIAAPTIIVAADGITADLRQMLCDEEAGRANVALLGEDRFGELVDAEVGDLDPHEALGKDVAHLQFTSGSTGEPKAVPIRHAQIVAHSFIVARSGTIDESDRFIGWLPLHHDFGFFVTLMAAIVVSADSVQIVPRLFARAPAVWLRAISMYRGTVSAAPPSALSILARQLQLAGCADLDLSNWRILWVAAEPLFLDRLLAFESLLKPLGLREQVVRPAYGMAEAVVALTAFRGKGSVEATERHGAVIVDCGAPVEGIELEIRSEEGRRAAEGETGEIYVRGETVCDGYWGEEPRRDPWFGTGDLGFLLDGHLFVTGRKKDLIIRAGASVHPHWIESAVESLDRSAIGSDVVRACAFARRSEQLGREEVVVVVEVRGGEGSASARDAVRRQVLQCVGVQLDRVHFVAPGEIPRTTSGKLQRTLCASLVK